MTGVKKYYLLMLCGCAVLPLAAQVQLRVETQGLRALAPDTVQSVQYVAPEEIGTTRLWDFSRLHPESKPVESVIYDTTNRTVVIREAETRFYFRPEADGNYYDGWEHPGKTVVLHAAYNKLPLPFSAGQSYSTSYTAEGRFTRSGVVTTIDGTYTVTADAEGTVILPDGRELCEAVRVKTTDQYHETNCNTTEVTIEKYLWYVPYYPLPVFVTAQTAYEYTGGLRDTVQAAYYTTNAMPQAEVRSINDTTICLGREVLLTATGVGELSWRNMTGDTDFVPFSDVTVTPAVTTTYVFKAEIAPCLPFAYDTVTITVHAPPNLTVHTADTTLCQTDSVVLRATSNYALQWYEQRPSGASEPLAEPTVAPEVTTRYIVVASQAPCPSQAATITITVLPVPEPVFLIEQSENEVTVQLPSILEKGYSYNFDFGDRSQTVNQTGMAHQYVKRGTYYVTLTIQRDHTSCTRSLIREIRIDADVPGEFMLYPNPASHLINVIAPSEILYYRIIQAGRGEVIKESSLPGDETRIQITVQQVPLSVYVLQIRTRSHGWMSKTFVKSP
jgi:PKD repeat protein